MEQIFDLVIIGGGPAGYEAAVEAAKYKMKTALIEKGEIGGTCLNRGCIPTKTLLHSSGLYAQMKKSSIFGVHSGALQYSMEGMQERKNEVIGTLRDGILSLMKKNKITVYSGRGMILDTNHVEVFTEEAAESDTDHVQIGVKADTNADRQNSVKADTNADCVQNGTENRVVLEARRILIASGSVPALPPIAGVTLPNVLTSDGLLDKKDVFSSITIIGGGVIGMEFAAIYSALGCKVTVIEFLDRILANMDREISQNLKMILKKRGVDIFTGARVEEIAEDGCGRLICRYREKDETKEIISDGILVSVGRRAYTQGLFSDAFVCGNGDDVNVSDGKLFIKTDRGRICVDNFGRTNIPNIYAAGDVTGGAMLAHAATAQAVNAVCHMAGKAPVFSMKGIPGCVYTEPEIASIGMTQDEAKKAGLHVIVRKYPMSANGKTVLEDCERGFVKVVADEESHRILGAQMMCARASDMISQFTAAIVNGLTLEQMASVIYPHPTFSEGIGACVRE